MLISPRKVIIRISVELCALAVLVLAVLNFKTLWGEPATRGFFCNDLTLNYPYRQDTISPGVLYVLGFYAPVVFIGACEAWKFFKNGIGPQAAATSLPPHWTRVSCLALAIYNNMRMFIFGFAVERLIKDVAKYSVGRLRPCFLDVCQPEFADESNCSDPDNRDVYQEEYYCGNVAATAEMLADVHISFPSGHASLSFYAMVFLVLYLNRAFGSRSCVGSTLLGRVLQFACVLLAWFVALSRVANHKHHWTDVLAGMVLGTSAAVAASLYVVNVEHFEAVQPLSKQTGSTYVEREAIAVHAPEDMKSVKVADN